MKTVLIIPMSGNGTRMGPVCDIVPKGLVNYHNHTFIYHIYHYYKDLVDECIITVQSKHAELTKQYVDNFDLDVRIVIDDTLSGNNWVLDLVDVKTQRVILNWCDVIPVDVDVSTPLDSVCVFTMPNTGRYKIVDSKIVETRVDDGDFCGVYVFNAYTNDIEEIESGDVVDLMIHNNMNCIERGCTVLDLGTREKLKNTQSTIPLGRYFNELKFTDTSVVKTGIGDIGMMRVAGEIEILSENRKYYTPITKLSEFSYSMPRYYDFTMPRCLNEVTIPRNIKSKSSESDIRIEVSGRILSRLYSISEYGDIDVERCKSLVKKLEQYIVDNTSHFYEIHGDLICDNVLILSDGEQVFIDPRYMFGESRYGPIEYDTSKMLYSLNGYYDFNYNVVYDGDFESYDIHTEMSLLEEAWVCSHWMALAGFFKNNPAKAIGAYEIGMRKLNRIISKICND